MGNKYVLMTVALLIGLYACECDDLPQQEIEDGTTLIFGHFYGECIGEGCIETFKLTESALFEDTLDQYSGSMPFAFVPLSADLFAQVEYLRDAFPDELWTETEPVFGCPDCADQGGLFIQYEDDGEVRSWRIDQDQAAVPEYLHSFMDQVNQSIALLQ